MDNKSQYAFESAVLACPLKIWEEFFQKQKQDEYEQVRSATVDRLTEIKQTIKVLDKMEAQFRSIHQNHKK